MPICQRLPFELNPHRQFPIPHDDAAVVEGLWQGKDEKEDESRERKMGNHFWLLTFTGCVTIIMLLLLTKPISWDYPNNLLAIISIYDSSSFLRHDKALPQFSFLFASPWIFNLANCIIVIGLKSHESNYPIILSLKNVLKRWKDHKSTWLGEKGYCDCSHNWKKYLRLKQGCQSSTGKRSDCLSVKNV